MGLEPECTGRPLGTVGSRDNITTRHSKHHNQENAKFCPFRLVWVNIPLSPRQTELNQRQREAMTSKTHNQKKNLINSNMGPVPDAWYVDGCTVVVLG